MTVVDDRVRLEREFIQLAQKYNDEGLVEYLLWETIEGKRDRPYKFLDPLTPEENALLANLRGVAKIWVFWQNGQWCHADVEAWRVHAETTTAYAVMNHRCNGF